MPRKRQKQQHTYTHETKIENNTQSNPLNLDPDIDHEMKHQNDQNEIIYLGEDMEQLFDITLIYQNKFENANIHFRTHKPCLANKSHYFKQLFIADPNIKKILIPESIIEQTNSKQFHQFLRLIYSSTSIAMDYENCFSILYCSHYFDTKFNEIENKLIQFFVKLIQSNEFTDEFTLIHLLLLADRYHLQPVVDICIEQLFHDGTEKK
jgi:hypothetical protein